MKFVTNLDLNKNQLLNAVIQNLTTDPSSPIQGQVYYHSSNKRLVIYQGSAWETIPTSTTITNADISSSAAIALSKLATDPLDRSNHTGTQAASTISDFDTQVRTNRIDQLTAPTSSVSLNSQKITSLADPVSDTDAANKRYVDTAIQGLDVKDSVKVAYSTNISLTGTASAEGSVTPANGERVLVMGQTTTTENGIYVVNTSGSWSRATDSDSWNELVGAFVFVEQGSNADSGFVCTADAGGTLGGSAVAFTQFSSAGSVSAGSGLSKSGSQIDVGEGDGIQVDADSITIKIDGATLSKSATGLKIDSGGVTETELNSSVAGNGLTGGGGTALSVGAGSGITVNADDVAVTAGGITETHLSTSVAGDGLIGGGGTALAVGGTTDRITVSANAVDISANYVGQATINTLGTVTSGTWNGTAIAVANGGTGGTTAESARTNLGAVGKYAADIGDGASTSFVITHNLNSRDVNVSIRTVASPYEFIIADIEATSVNTVTVKFSTAPLIGFYRVTVMG